MAKKDRKKLDPILTGVAGAYYVAAELSRRGIIATMTLRNTRGIDILASDAGGKNVVGIQVKTRQNSKQHWLLNAKAEKLRARDLFYVFVNLNEGTDVGATYHIVEAATVARHVARRHRRWLKKPRRDGTAHTDNSIRGFRDDDGDYRGAWDRLPFGLTADADPTPCSE